MARSNYVSVDGNDFTDQGTYIPAKSKGTHKLSCDLDTLFNFWTPQKPFEHPMLQVGPGCRWCKTCGNVRPLSYFEVLEWDERGRITEVDDHGQPIVWDGVPFPTRYSDECRECINSRDPKQAKEKYCSACKMMHSREAFVDDDRYSDGKFPSCRDAKKRYDSANHARKKWLNEGALPSEWGGHREKVAI